MLLALDAYLIRIVMRSKSPSSGEENIICMLRILRLIIAPIMEAQRLEGKGSISNVNSKPNQKSQGRPLRKLAIYSLNRKSGVRIHKICAIPLICHHRWHHDTKGELKAHTCGTFERCRLNFS